MVDKTNGTKTFTGFRKWLHETIFEADTLAGIIFDIGLLIAILVSVAVVCLDTVEELDGYRDTFLMLEWVFTILFTIEYILRLYCVYRPWKYATSFYGIIDLVAFLPLYIGLLFSGSASFAVVRSFRLLRVFRILKLVWLMSAADELGRAIWYSRAKLIVFVSIVSIAVVVAGTVMYEIEHRENPEAFSSIPESIYWAIVTMTTVGYGDIVPGTVQGKMVAALLILFGYSLIIVPTGFVSVEFMEMRKKEMVTTQSCPHCIRQGHEPDAQYCKYCGELL